MTLSITQSNAAVTKWIIHLLLNDSLWEEGVLDAFAKEDISANNDTGSTAIDQTDFLIEQITRQNDPKAFQRLFDLFYVPLCIYAKRFIDDKETREDIVQDVFFLLWEKRKTIIINASVKNYMMTSVKNHCLNYLRKQCYAEEYEAQLKARSANYMEYPDQLYYLLELQELISKTLEKLPEEYRIALVMNRMEGKSTIEIADYLGVSSRTVERHLSRALDILRSDLKEFLAV